MTGIIDSKKITEMAKSLFAEKRAGMRLDGWFLSKEIQIKYEGYIKRELLEVEKARRLEEKHIPDSIDYNKILGLRLEAVEKLSAIRPLNIGQASRISGVSPADIGVLLIYLSGQGKKPD